MDLFLIYNFNKNDWKSILFFSYFHILYFYIFFFKLGIRNCKISNLIIFIFKFRKKIK